MRHYLTFAICLLLILPALAQKKAEKGVKKCFESYREAILNENGTEAYQWIDQNTIDFYSKTLELAISGDSATIDGLAFMDKFLALTARHRVPNEQLLQMDKKSFFVYAVDEGMIGKESVQELQLTTVTVDGKQAEGKFNARGNPAPFGFTFNKMGKQWGIDLTSIFEITSKAILMIYEGETSDSNEIIFKLLTFVTGEEPGPEIWQPLK